MTRRRAGLHAILDPTRSRVLCGRCRADIGWVSADRRSKAERILVLPTSMTPGRDDGIWRRMKRADAAERSGRQPTRRAADTKPERPPDGWMPWRQTDQPLRVECPECEAVQAVIESDLDVSDRRWSGSAAATPWEPWWKILDDQPVRGLRSR